MRNSKGFLVDCLFVGIEAEGPYRGSKTLFVATNHTSFKRIWEAAQSHCAKNIYFGAGGTFSFPEGITRGEILRLCQHYVLMLETNNPATMNWFHWWFPEIKIILNLPATPDFIKVDNPEEGYSTMSDLFSATHCRTPYNDPFYEEDIEV